MNVDIEIIQPKDLIKECNETIEFLLVTKKLTPAQAYVICKMLIESFPENIVIKEVKRK